MKKLLIIILGVAVIGAAVYFITNMQKTADQTQTKQTVYEIEIKNHIFIPDQITANADEAFKLLIHNRDETPEEFESDDFRREKIIPGSSSATILVAPLKPGKYHFFGEFNEDTANGYITVE